MAKQLRPSARQMRSEFEQRAFSGLTGSGTLAGLGLAGKPKILDDRSVSEFRKRVLAQEASISDLQREQLDLKITSEALAKEHASVAKFSAEISGQEPSSQAMADYVAAAEHAAQRLESEIAQGRAAVENLKKIAHFEELDLDFLITMIGNYRGRVLSSLSSTAGVLFVPERLPDRKYLAYRKTRPPPMSPLDETPERKHAKVTSRKFDKLSEALLSCVWNRKLERRKMCKLVFDKLAAVKKHSSIADSPDDRQIRPHTSGAVMKKTTASVSILNSHTASFFAYAKKISPYMQTLSVVSKTRAR